MYKIFRYILQKIKIYSIANEKNLKKKFTLIYNSNYWGDKESISGPGSNKKNTISVSKNLSRIIKSYNIRSIVDGPCGDFNWINKIIKNNKIHYMGLDIVEQLILKNKKKYSNKNVFFKNSNLLINTIPKCDLIICRDFLFHLSYQDIRKYFKNLYKSNFKFILLSNHTHGNENKILFSNKNIKSGDFRKINIFKSPFLFEKNYEFYFEDYCDNKKKYLLFFKSREIKKSIKKFIIKKNER